MIDRCSDDDNEETGGDAAARIVARGPQIRVLSINFGEQIKTPRIRISAAHTGWKAGKGWTA